jgi:glycosyl hydrolase family 19 (putative chitinase)
MSISHKVFYNGVRKPVFGGSLSQSAVDNMEVVLDYWFTHYPNNPLNQLAYILATMRREVGARMAPVRETFAKSDAQARKNLAGKAYAKSAGPFAHAYYGRGYVQLTWLKNYEHQQGKLGIPIVENPDLVLESPTAVKILVEGMMDGDFNGAGHGLAHYVNDVKQDFINARRTVNGTDNASEIAGNAKFFLSALDEAVAAAPDDVALKPSKEHELAKESEPADVDVVVDDGSGSRLQDVLEKLAVLIGGLKAGTLGTSTLDPRTRDILAKMQTLTANLEGVDTSKLKVLTDDLDKVLGVKPELTQVNGAFGETVGHLLDGRKTAIGILGTLASFLLGGTDGAATLTAANVGSVVGPILATVGGASPILLPLTLAITAWGVLGKVDKWVKKS